VIARRGLLKCDEPEPVRKRKGGVPSNSLEPPMQTSHRLMDRKRFCLRAEVRRLFRGTLAPLRRASERPIAIAYLRLVTFLPERPDRKVPCFRSRMARSTF
jgi:hypothetical protein